MKYELKIPKYIINNKII